MYSFQLTSLVGSFCNLLLKCNDNNILIAFKVLPSKYYYFGHFLRGKLLIIQFYNNMVKKYNIAKIHC